jgi:glycosyltransferase involved in cell wall biosynthesis
MNLKLNLDVVVCVKNQALLLNRVLEQIVEYIPYKNLIVIYGNSIDETKEIAERFTKNVFWDGDKGLGTARNLGIQKATSEIVAMIDADIILTKSWYQQLIGEFRNPAVAAVMGTCLYGYGFKPLESYWEYIRRTEKLNFGCQNTLFRRETVLKVGNFDKKIKGAGEDYDLYLRLLSNGNKWVWVRKATVYHPMTMQEYIKHVRWWTRGQPYITDIARCVWSKSLFRVYLRQLLLCLEDVPKTAILSVVVHPTFLLYWPIIRATCTLEVFKSLKKRFKNKNDSSL